MPDTCSVELTATPTLSSLPDSGYFILGGLPSTISISGLAKLPVGVIAALLAGSGKVKFYLWQIEVGVTLDSAGVVVLTDSTLSFIIENIHVLQDSVFITSDAGTEIKRDVTDQQSYGVVYNTNPLINLFQTFNNGDKIIVHYAYTLS